MRKLLALLTVMTVMLSCTKRPEPVIDPEFVGRVVAMLAKDQQSVVIAWEEIGLKADTNIDYEARASAITKYVCVNAKDKCTEMHTVTLTISANATLLSNREGKISGGITMLPPTAGEFACPGNQELILAEIFFTEIQIEDVTNGVLAGALPSELGAVVFSCQ